MSKGWSSYLWGNRKGLASDGGPPYHQIGESCDPKDTTDESNKEELLSCKADKTFISQRHQLPI